MPSMTAAAEYPVEAAKATESFRGGFACLEVLPAP
jgi:hypothetical protein